MNDSTYNLSAGRSEAQIQNMKELQKKGICFMCYENLVTYEKNRIIFETDHWVVTPNAYPYEHSTLHLLLVSKTHVGTMDSVGKAARQGFMETLLEVEKRWKLDSYAVGMRIGDIRYNGASVDHLHAHVVVGERDPEKFQPVRFKMTSLPEK